jgi:hypothetical protein
MDGRTGISTSSNDIFATSSGIGRASLVGSKQQVPGLINITVKRRKHEQRSQGYCTTDEHVSRAAAMTRSPKLFRSEAPRLIVEWANSKQKAPSFKQTSVRVRRRRNRFHGGVQRTFGHPAEEERNHVHLYWHPKRLKATTRLARWKQQKSTFTPIYSAREAQAKTTTAVHKRGTDIAINCKESLTSVSPSAGRTASRLLKLTKAEQAAHRLMRKAHTA